MTIGPVLLEMLEQIEDDQYTDQVKATLKNQIESATVDLTRDPRDRTDGNLKLLNAAMLVGLGTAQDLYGVGDDTAFHPLPLFEAQPQSQIAPLLGDHDTVAIVLGLYVTSWEEVFYDICHESLHLLNPVTHVKDSRVKVSALEEGVAVKFAEQMYGKYIKAYCDRTPATSPVNDPDSQYFKAYAAARKIPDEILRKVREVFGKFSCIDDADRFRELVRDYVSAEEVGVLLAPVRYPGR